MPFLSASSRVRRLAPLWLAALLTACGGGGDAEAPAAVYHVSGKVSGLASNSTLVVAFNGTETVTLNANGSFALTTPLPDNGAYTLAVKSQPSGQLCSVSGGSGFVSAADVSSVVVSCENVWTVGGTVAGLGTGATVALQLDNGETVPVSANGSFVFESVRASGKTYAVTVATQPEEQNCTVANGSGTLAGANVSNVAVSCVNLPPTEYRIGGTVSGLVSGGSLTVLLNGANAKTISANGNFSFDRTLQNGNSYAATVGSMPVTQDCTVANGAGTVARAAVNTIAITCTTPTYSVGGTVTGLPNGASITLAGAGGETKVITGTGATQAFTMNNRLANTAAYSVSVATQPTGGNPICVVSSGSGTIPKANVNSVQIACASYTQFAYTINKGANTIGMFAISPANGELTPLGVQAIPVGTDAGLSGLTVPTAGAMAGKVLYASLYNHVQAYSIGTDGRLSVLGSAIATNGQEQPAIVVNPAGTHAFVTGRGMGRVYVLAIDGTTGALNWVSTYQGTADTQPRDLSISPDGKFLYVAHFGAACDPTVAGATCPDGTNPRQHIDVLAVNATSGALSLASAVTTDTVNDVGTYAILATATMVYDTAYGDNTVTAWQRDATTGALTRVASTSSQAGPIALTANAGGSRVYVSNYSQVFAKYGGPTIANSITVYTINGDGSLSPLTSYAANKGIRGLKFDATGNHAYSIGAEEGNLTHWTVSGGALTAVSTVAAGTSTGNTTWSLAIANRAN